MATKVQITGTLLGSLGLRDNTVTATLVDLNGTPRLGFVTAAQSELVAPVATTSNSDGSWSLSLYGNADITSDYGDTLYRITEGPGFNQFGSNVYYVGVPVTGGPYWARDLVVTPPGGAAPESFQVVSVDGMTGAVDLSSRYVNVSGDTMTGALTLSGDPTNALHAATKQYIDNISGSLTGGPFLPLSGGTMTGAIVLAGDPDSALKAATKQYVDAETTRATAAEALLAPKASPTFTGTVSGITKSMVGLGNVDNTSDANKPVSTATQTALNLKANLASPTFTGTVGGITKSMVGLGNVDNTADTAKPVSTAQQTALDLKANLASPTFTGTVNAAAITTTGNVSVGGNLSVTGIGQKQFVRATADQSITSSQTASTYLVLPVVANAKYIVRAGVIADSTSGVLTPGWTLPSGTTIKWSNSTASADYSSTTTGGTFPALAGTRMIFFEGIVQVSSTAGNVTFTASSGGNAGHIYTDSYLTLERVV